MTEADLLVATLKKQLKNQGMTYRDVAKAIKLSEPSVKRLFASGRFTVDRLAQISNLLGFTLAELSKEALQNQPRLSTLTEKQEREIVSDSKLMMVAVCVLNHWTMDEIVGAYKLSSPECLKYLLRLDGLRIIDLLPNNRIRIIVARDFDWLPSGPIRQFFRSKGIDDLLKSEFDRKDETMTFVHGMFTEQAISVILDELGRLRKKFAELHEESLSAPLSMRRGFGLLYAMRQWEPVDFVKLRR